MNLKSISKFPWKVSNVRINLFENVYQHIIKNVNFFNCNCSMNVKISIQKIYLRDEERMH